MDSTSRYKGEIKLTKVIIVSPKEIHDYFTSSYEDWDTQVPVVSVEDVWTGLQTGTLSPESEIIIFTDALMRDSGEDLSVAIATFAPDALVLIIFYDMDNVPILQEAVAKKKYELDLGAGRFFAIDTSKDIGGEIYDAYNIYANGEEGGESTDTYVPEPEYVVEDEPVAEYEYQDVAPVEQATAPGYGTPVADYVAEHPNTAFAAQRGLVVASTSSKGGSGKTTVALCTASMAYYASMAAVNAGLREKPLSVVIVDMDTRDGQIGFLLSQVAPTALNIFIAEDKSIETIRKNLVYDERLGVHALLAPKRARTADYLQPEFYQDIIQKLRTMFDLVVLDTSVNYLDALLSKVVLPISDAVMFVTNLSVGSVYGMNRWMEEVTTPVEAGGAGISNNKIGIVVNQSAPDLGISPELLRDASAGAELLVAIPLDSGAMIAASNHNRLSDIIVHHAEISPAYFKIVKQLLPGETLLDPYREYGANAAPSVAPKPIVPSQSPAVGNASAQPKKKRKMFGK
jgi:septum formation inhibitor-activating ATPase MinD